MSSGDAAECRQAHTILTSVRSSPFPISARVAASLSWLAGAGFVVLAGLSSGSGHGSVSWEIAALLAGYGLLQAASGWWLWRGSPFARGPVVALALLNAFVAGQYVGGAPAAWLLLVVSVTTVVCAVLPSTTRALVTRRPPN